MFQKIEVAPEIRAESTLDHGVDYATGFLDRMIGDPSRLVTVRWEKVFDDKTRPILRIKLQDGAAEAEAYFTADELMDDRVLRDKFFDTYDDLLQIRSHKLL